MPNLMKMIDKKLAAAILILGCMAASLVSCNKTPSADFDLKVVKLHQGWGYEIRKNNKPFIYQECIPAVGGNQAFTDKKSAKKTGRLVLGKLQNQKAPGVSKAELIQLGVIGE